MNQEKDSAFKITLVENLTEYKYKTLVKALLDQCRLSYDGKSLDFGGNDALVLLKHLEPDTYDLALTCAQNRKREQDAASEKKSAATEKSKETKHSAKSLEF
jgi:hypothetical protein